MKVKKSGTGLVIAISLGVVLLGITAYKGVTAYGVTGDTLVLVRPDGYLALRAPGASRTAVRDYLDRVGVSRSA